APAPGADRAPAERRVAHTAFRRHEGRRTDRPGLGRRRAHPAPRELATPGTRGVLVAGHPRTGQGTIPDSRVVGGFARRGGGLRDGARHPPTVPGWHSAPTSIFGASPPEARAMIGNLSRRDRTLIGAPAGIPLTVLGWVVVVL